MLCLCSGIVSILICRTVIDVELLMATVNGNELVNFCTPADCSHVLHSGLVYFI